MKRLILGISLVGVASAVVVGFLLKGGSTPAASYRLVAVERGDISSTVSATGALSAVRTVAVGTQVSGQIAALGANFNDHVTRGQVIARLDSTLLSQAVQQAQTDVDKARASAEQTRSLSDQAGRLLAAGVITDTENRAIVYNAALAQTALQSSQIALERAQRNLQYATIRSPIDGIVIQRDVDVGQTVAASLQAPQLFVIAESLRRMQILASVDESDIGVIRTGQAVRFTVQAYPNRTFLGTVQQVRLQSKTDQNVVNYPVVVSVDNADLALLPGMTTTVSFEVAKATNVLKVANSAIRFRATAPMQAEWLAAHPDSARPRGDSTRRGTPADSVLRRVRGDTTAAARSASGAGAGQRRANVAQLWYLDASGRPAMMVVRTGLTDGQTTEISGRVVTEGMQVITALAAGGTAATASTTSTNPFQPAQAQQRGGGPRPPGGM